MKTNKTILVMLILVSILLVSGCVQQTPQNKTDAQEIKSEKDVAAVVGDVSEDISSFAKELESIDTGLG